MAHYPTSKEIKLWTASAIDVFQSVMPPINIPYTCVHISTAQTFPKMRAELLAQTGCKHTEANMEYIHGDKGYVS